MRALVFCSALAAAAAISVAARAQTAEPEPPLKVPVRHPGYWARGEARPFVASTIDVGYLYLRPRLTLGYGKPFALWAGMDVNPIALATGVGAYAGLRLQIPWFDLRAGARGFYAFQHTLLPQQPSYTSVDLNQTTGRASEYVTLETELSGGIPAGPGSILLVLTASAVEGVPAGYDVYEETLRVITDPPAIYRARTGYALRFGSEGSARVGLVGEVLDLPRRGEVVYRAGLVGSFAIDDHLEALGLLVLPVYSPDSIGIAGGDYAELGLRYRWASGEGAPNL
jgi:hypothetical protein